MGLKSSLLKVLLPVFAVAVFVSPAEAAAPDGLGPWADEVVTSSQANTKGGTPVSTVNPARSDPTSALGVAENDTVDSHFFSLGFGGSITLRFDNGISSGVFVVEATNPGYPLEKADVEISEDGSTWFAAGQVVQDGSVNVPEGISCATYVRITDASDPNDFTEDTADAYDVDGVEAQGEPCDPPASPTPTPTPTPTTAPSTPSSLSSPGPPVCGAQAPTTPTLVSVSRTSSTTAELVWTAASPVTHYTISYGTSPGNYLFGVPNTGNTTSYVVGGLVPNTNYYFVVTAVNDCATSSASSELSTGGAVLGAATGQVLGASTDTLAQAGKDRLALRLLVTSLAVLATFLLGTRLLPKNEKS